MRILSPRRKRFENHFDDYLVGKYVEQPLVELPEREKRLFERPQFDTLTKAQDSQNAKQTYNKLLQEAQRQATHEQG